MRKETEMSKLNHFTVEIYKADKRIKKDERYGKNKKGLRFVEVRDFAPTTRDHISTVAQSLQEAGFITQVFETWVVKKNMISGQEYAERYDTPHFCSPSSETYWSM